MTVPALPTMPVYAGYYAMNHNDALSIRRDDLYDYT